MITIRRQKNNFLAKHLSKMKEKIRCFHKAKTKRFTVSKLTLKEMLRAALQSEDKWPLEEP